MKRRIEDGFAQLGDWSYDRPWVFILLSCALLFFFCWQLQFLKVDTTTEGFLEKGDPQLVAFDEFKKEFGRDEQFIVAIASDDIFTPDFLKRLIEMHRALEVQVPYIDEVDSLHDVRDIYGEDDDLIVDDLMQEAPLDQQAADQLKQKVFANPLYINSFVSSDGELVNIYLRPDRFYAVTDEQGNVSYELLGDQQIHEMYLAIADVVKKFEGFGDKILIAGTPAITEELNVYLVGDMLKFIAMALGFIALVLFLLFKRLLSVILPMVVMITALVSTMGLMSLTNQPVQMPTVILPSFILAVGVGDSIHLLTIFFRRLKFGDERKLAIANAMRHTGLPMFFTTITTAASLCSFGRSEILPVANLGLFAAAGVTFAFIYTMLLLPALLAISPVKTRSTAVESDAKKPSWFDAFLDFSVNFSINHSGKIIVSGLLIMTCALYSASQLGFSHNPVEWLPNDSPGRKSIEFVGGKIGGSVPIEVVIDSGEFDGVKSPEFLQKVDQVVTEFEQYKTEKITVGNVISIAEMLKETNKALMSNSPEAYIVPDNRALIAQEFLMLETSGAEDLFKMLDSNYQKARITIMTPWVDALYFGDFVKDVKTKLEGTFGSQYEIVVTGVVPMLSTTLRQIMEATAVSYFIAFLVISFMMIALLGSVKYGLISMIPNLLPITIALGLMQLTGAPLDMFSMLIGSIAIGLSVDDTVHFMHGFRRVYEQTGDAEKAVRETLHSSGRAMLSTTIVLSAGFLIYLFSAMHNLQDFGFYTALCIFMALLADFWLAPALVLTMNKVKGN